MSKKTERKNKTNLIVNWPTTPLFTLEDVFALQPEAKKITLRVRLTKRIERQEVIEIGCKTGGQGRPPKVFAFTPVSGTTWELAKSQKISLVEENRRQPAATLARPMAVPFPPKVKMSAI
jgi:hypothetical protein